MVREVVRTVTVCIHRRPRAAGFSPRKMHEKDYRFVLSRLCCARRVLIIGQVFPDKST